MTDLLIGGGGFIGAYLARALLEAGRPVAIYDRDVRTSPLNSLLRPDELSRLTLLAGDVADPVHLLRTVGELRPERIVHLAAVLTPAGQADPASAARVITMGTVHALEAARAFGVRRLVWASSAQVFGPLERYRRRHGVERIMDDATPDPVTIYGACKAQAEHLATHYARAFGLEVTGLRPCGTLGRGRRGGATFEIFELVARAARGEAAVARRADWVQPLIHIADVVAAFQAALDQPTPATGKVYNLGAIPTTTRAIARHLQSRLPHAQIEIEPSDDPPPAVLDNSGISADLGFQPRFSLESAIDDLLNDALGR